MAELFHTCDPDIENISCARTEDLCKFVKESYRKFLKACAEGEIDMEVYKK